MKPFNFIVQPMLVAAKLWMWSIKPLRKLGFFGTPDNPVYFEKGDKVPIYIEACYAIEMVEQLIFTCDAESYYDKKEQYQIVRPLYFHNATIMHVHMNHGVLVGAPTCFIHTPRNKYIGKMEPVPA